MQYRKDAPKVRRISGPKQPPATPQNEIVKGVVTFIDLIKNPIKLKRVVDELRRIVREADEKKASVWIPIFQQEYPQAYMFISALVDLPPDAAAVALMERWPALGLMTAYPDHLDVIQFLQRQIRMRRGKDDQNTHMAIR